MRQNYLKIYFFCIAYLIFGDVITFFQFKCSNAIVNIVYLVFVFFGVLFVGGILFAKRDAVLKELGDSTAEKKLIEINAIYAMSSILLVVLSLPIATISLEQLLTPENLQGSINTVEAFKQHLYINIAVATCIAIGIAFSPYIGYYTGKHFFNKMKVSIT